MVERSESEALEVPPNLTIVGAGGCGKKLSFEICKHEWFLGHYLQNSERDLRIYIIDTDENEVELDKEEVEKINKRMEAMKERSNIASFYYLPSLANISRVSDLTSEEVRDSIKKRDESVKKWWLHDPECGIDFNTIRELDPMVHEDFGGGVKRRRAISKAIFYKVKNEASVSFPTFSGGESIAIIVGLGGGTGSGIFFDVARYIRNSIGKEGEIWLFIVLPTTLEGEKEKLNAAIALTELEYLALGKKNLFRRIILIALEPTEYTSGPGIKKEVQEFDSIFPYIFVNSFYLARRDVDVSDAIKPYSFFISSTAHVIEYPIKELEELKKDFGKAINEMEKVTGKRKELNDRIRGLGRERYGTPTNEDFEFIKERVKDIKKIWECDIGRILQYQAPKAIDFYIKNNIGKRFEEIDRYKDLVEWISRLKEFTITKEGSLRDEHDRELRELIPMSLEVTEDTADLFKLISGIENEKVRRALKEILKGTVNIIVVMGELRGEIIDLETKRKELEEEIEKLKKKIENYELEEEEADKNVEKKMNEITRCIDFDSLDNIYSRISTTREKEPGLKMRIEKILNDSKNTEVKGFNNEDEWLNNKGVIEVQREIDSIEITHEYKDNLKSLIKDASLYYYYYNKENLPITFRERIVGLLTGKSPSIERRQSFGTKAENMKNSVKRNASYWNIEINRLELNIPEDFLTKRLNDKAERTKNELKNLLLRDFKFEGERNELENILIQQNSVEIKRRISELLSTISKREFKSKIERTRSEIMDKEEKIKEKEKTEEFMRRVEKFSDETFRLRDELYKHLKSFENTFTGIRKGVEIGRTEKSLYRTKFRDINPNVLSVIEDSNSGMDILSNHDIGKKELDKLLNEIIRTYPALFDTHKLGISNLRIPLSETERWNFRKVGLVISCASSYIREEIESNRNYGNITSNLNHSLSLKKPNDARLTSHTHVKPWEISLVSFTAANFLDNISLLTAGGGYWKIYERQKNNLLHHALLLNDGEYITRERLLKPEKAGEKGKREEEGTKEENEVKKEVSNIIKRWEYTTREGLLRPEKAGEKGKREEEGTKEENEVKKSF